MRQTILDHVTLGLFTAALLDILGSVDVDPALSVREPVDAAPDGRIFSD